MKSLMKAVDRFCYKHPNFGIPRLMLYMVIGNAIVFLFSMMDTTGTFLSYLYFNPQRFLKGEVWRILTFMFVPDSTSLFSEALALYFYYFIGNTLESVWGKGRFTIYYLSGVLFTVIFCLVLALCGYSGAAYFYINGSYINLSLFFAFAMIFPDMRVFLFFLIPIKIKWLAIVDAVLFVLGIVTSPFPVNLLPVVAVLNFLLYFAGDLFGGAKGKKQAYKAGAKFRSEVRNAEIRRDETPYRHKCAVCGKTDVSHPDLEFRYCSRCAGYHCFCSEHISSHVHFTE